MSDYRNSSISDITGRVAVVTGGGTGVGLMIASGLAANGAKVYITGRRAAVLEKAAAIDIVGAEHRLIPLQTDVTDLTSIKNAVKTIEANEGRLDILVNNAGTTGFSGSFESVVGEAQRTGVPPPADSVDNWTNIYRTNVVAPYFVTTEFAPLLTKGAAEAETASVVNITSMAGITHLPMHMPGYVVSKGAAEHLSKVLATDFALRGVPIRINTIALGTYASDMTGQDAFIDAYVRKYKAGEVGGYALPRAGRAEDVIGTVVYLSSAASKYANGTSIRLDGGFSILNP